MFESTKASTNDKYGATSGYSQPMRGGVDQLFQVLEGPGVMRGLAIVAGAGLVAGTLMDILHREKNHIVLQTPSLVLQAYVIVFGLVIVLNELKSVNSPKLAEWRDKVFQWMPFLSVTLGKGLFMILTSSVGLAFQGTMFVWAPSVAVFLIGLVYVIFYVGNRQEQDAAISASMQYSPIPDGFNPNNEYNRWV